MHVIVRLTASTSSPGPFVTLGRELLSSSQHDKRPLGRGFDSTSGLKGVDV